MICQITKSTAVMDGHIEFIEMADIAGSPVSTIHLKSRRTLTAQGDWTKIIMRAKKVGAVWCCPTRLELKS